MNHKETIAISIPTGIGAEIGGFAGDGGKIARKFAKHFNVLTHPNVVNGGILSAITDDILYLEGYFFDEFFSGNIVINPLDKYEENIIGVIFDASIPKNILNIHINTISAMKEVKGLNIPFFEITDEPVGVEFFIKNNLSTGTIKNENAILRAAKKLIEKGANAIAIVCYFNEDADDINYEQGIGIDPIGGIEAVISHLIAKEFFVPTAHAPAFSSIDIYENICNSKVSSENISSTYLPCILDGLSKAPLINNKNRFYLKNSDIKALIVPYNALGSPAVIGAYNGGIKILTVKNKTFGSIGCYDMGLNDIIEYEDYDSLLSALLKG